jgi:hypothetical protein
MANNKFKSMQGELASMGEIINVISRDEHMTKLRYTTEPSKSACGLVTTPSPTSMCVQSSSSNSCIPRFSGEDMFALKGSISLTQSPSEIILNQKLDFNVHCKVEFGEYV